MESIEIMDLEISGAKIIKISTMQNRVFKIKKAYKDNLEQRIPDRYGLKGKDRWFNSLFKPDTLYEYNRESLIIYAEYFCNNFTDFTFSLSESPSPLGLPLSLKFTKKENIEDNQDPTKEKQPSRNINEKNQSFFFDGIFAYSIIDIDLEELSSRKDKEKPNSIEAKLSEVSSLLDQNLAHLYLPNETTERFDDYPFQECSYLYTGLVLIGNISLDNGKISYESGHDFRTAYEFKIQSFSYFNTLEGFRKFPMIFVEEKSNLSFEENMSFAISLSFFQTYMKWVPNIIDNEINDRTAKITNRFDEIRTILEREESYFNLRAKKWKEIDSLKFKLDINLTELDKMINSFEQIITLIPTNRGFRRVTERGIIVVGEDYTNIPYPVVFSGKVFKVVKIQDKYELVYQQNPIKEIENQIANMLPSGQASLFFQILRLKEYYQYKLNEYKQQSKNHEYMRDIVSHNFTIKSYQSAKTTSWIAISIGILSLIVAIVVLLILVLI